MSRARALTPGQEAEVIERPDLGRFFGSTEATFVLLDPSAERIVCFNPRRATERFLPASTFKIPNSLIALETGVASGPDFPLTWDSVATPQQEWWPAAWPQDHTLRTALANSVAWFYQELARRIGQRRMQAYVNRFGYGNRDLSGGVDKFWLTGGLRISANEQVGFLRRFRERQLGISERTTSLVEELLELEETADYRLIGKTGWAGLGEIDALQVGWFVGYLERDSEVYYFATNLEIRSRADAIARIENTRKILRALQLLPN